MHRSSEIKIGVLALQGDFQAHRDKLSSLGVSSIEVRKAEQLSNISGLILPGGESPAMLKLMDAKFRRSIRDIASDGLAVLATCAGIILLAKNVFSPRQESLNVLDIDVTRNAYGRQKDSFIEERLEWT
ncbi:MAG: pyridoxal 5'-phosphate synthase glutaminase subunit PdxT, partial [Deltaproteobacteria bacterium]|nr:pyridoxal 5'-phosphate synthase glutaminase subunit PdxT [Deltaproteobacteria bacterium]